MALNKEDKRITFDMPKDEYRSIEKHVESNDMTISQFFRRLVREFISTQKVK